MSCSSTRGGSSPPPARWRAWICACIWSRAITGRRSRLTRHGWRWRRFTVTAGRRSSSVTIRHASTTVWPRCSIGCSLISTSCSVWTPSRRVSTSPRTFARRFREQTGTTPLQRLLTARVRRAQELLETTAHAVDEIAYAAGFSAPVTFRARFQQVVGVSPSAYRRGFNAYGTSVAEDRRTDADERVSA